MMNNNDPFFENNKYIKKGSVKISKKYKAQVIIGRILKTIISLALLSIIGIGIYFGLTNMVRLPNGHIVETIEEDYKKETQVAIGPENKFERFLNTYKYLLSLEEAKICTIKYVPLEIITTNNQTFKMKNNEFAVQCNNEEDIYIINKNEIIGSIPK